MHLDNAKSTLVDCIRIKNKETIARISYKRKEDRHLWQEQNKNKHRNNSECTQVFRK